MGVGTGQRGGRWGRRDRESAVGTVVSPGASLGLGHINIDLSRGWSNEGQREHQPSAVMQASSNVIWKPAVSSTQASCEHSLWSFLMILPMPASSAPVESPSLDPQQLVTHPLPDHPLLQLIFRFKFLLSSLHPWTRLGQGENSFCPPIFPPKYLEIQEWVRCG